MAQQQTLQMTALQRAQRLAAWAGHQWGSAALNGNETTPAEIAATTRATTAPGLMGWGITSPDLTENGWVVRVGRAVRAEIGDGYLRFSVSQRDGAAITWENGAWVFSLYETSYNEITDNTIRIVPGRMVARSLALLVVLGIIEDEADIWVVRDRAGFPPFEDPNGADAAAEAEQYWQLRYNAGHLLAGPRYNWEREQAEREWEDLLDNDAGVGGDCI